MSAFNFSHLKERFHHILWETDISQLSKPRAHLLNAARITAAVLRDVTDGRLTRRATSLVYTTLLSLVPVLALSFAMLKAFGVHNLLEPSLIGLLAPLGDKGAEIAHQLVTFVGNVGVGVLGSLGLVMLIYTVVSLVQKIEEAFNYIWRVSSLRPLAQRISGYLSVVLLGPLLVFSAMGLTATVMSSSVVQSLLAIEPFGTLFYLLSKLLPYLLVTGAFTLTYMLIPNTRVRVSSALLGGTVAGILWQLMGWGFAAFVANSTQYTAIYSSFAIIVLFLIWLYASWLVLLLGSTIAFYHQNPAYPHPRATKMDQRSREALALEILRQVGLAHRGVGPRWTEQSLADAFNLPLELVDFVIAALIRGGLLVYTDDEPPYLMPGRDLETVTLKEVLDVMSGTAAAELPAFAGARVLAVMGQVDAAVAQSLHGQTVKDLLDSEDRAPPA